MGLLDFIFRKRATKVKRFLKNNAVIIDVRTPNEFKKGSVTNAKNIPLQELHQRVDEIKALQKPVIVCCASGIRSEKAAKFLNLNNIDAINGGGWKYLQQLISN